MAYLFFNNLFFPLARQLDAQNRKNRHFLSLGWKTVIFWHLDNKRSNYRVLGSNLGIVFNIYRVMIYINLVEVVTILMGFLGPINAFFGLVGVPNSTRGWIFNMLYYVSMWFHILTELIQVIWGYTKTFPPPGYMWKTAFRFFGNFQRGHVGPKTILICGFGQFSDFFSKIKIWIFMLTNLILVSIG